MKGSSLRMARAISAMGPAKVKRSLEKVPQSTQNSVCMLSTVTNAPFSKKSQTFLREVAKKHHYTSRHWVTLPQSGRTCNAVLLPGQQPAVLYLHVEKVVPFTSLSKKDQKRILDEFPPFFGGGVGILSERHKWKTVTAERLIRLLNATEEERTLFIDTQVAAELELKFDKKAVIDIRPASSISVYNAAQLDDPYKGEPQKGVALNASTGKRLAQPAHDILLGVGILRGYTSPMWVGESQMKYLNVELKPHAYHEAVAVPTMTGMIVSLSALPKDAQSELLRELRATQREAFGSDVYFIYGVNGWEAMRARALVKHMAAINDEQYPFHFVNLKYLRLQRPRLSSWVSRLTQSRKPVGSALLTKVVDEKSVVQQAESRIAIQGRCPPFFFAEDATLRRYYNAACMKEPHLMMPSVRPIAILNGKFIGARDESILRSFALQRKLSSPIWLTEGVAARLGVGILPRHKSHYVTIGAVAAERNPEEEVAEGFYNIDDFTKPAEILAMFPKASKRVHFMLDTKWRAVLGKQRQSFLAAQGRESPLWVSVNECLMSGFEPMADATLLSFPSGRKADSSGTRLYNSLHTTDPVRVIGLSTVYTRPQGLSVS